MRRVMGRALVGVALVMGGASAAVASSAPTDPAPADVAPAASASAAAPAASAPAVVPAVTPPAASASATDKPPLDPELVTRGLALFQGTTRLTNGGAACNSCHHVKNDAVIGGGILARELTSVFSRIGGAGVEAILGQPPFPVMQRAYAETPLTADEIAALSVFLQHADKERFYQQPRDYGWRLFTTGVAGAGVLLGLLGLAGLRRKRDTVNRAIFDRQAAQRSRDDV